MTIPPLLSRPETRHFNIGTLGSPVIATPGTANPAALSYFGQVNIPQDKEITVIHLHMISGGAAGQQLNLELYRRRDGNMVRIVELMYAATGGETYVTVGAVPVGELAMVRWSDYIFCQAVTGTTATPGTGLTVDVHFMFGDSGRQP